MTTETLRIVGLREWKPTPLGYSLSLRPEAPHLRHTQDLALGSILWASQQGEGPWGPRGFAGLIGCGHGKTLVAQLAPVVLGVDREDALLLLPARLSAQLDRDVAEWSPYYPLADPRRLTYERLSSPRAEHLLEKLRPKLLILDEAHKLANPQSARWRRLSRYIQRHPDTRVIILSGTLSWGKLRQMRHLMLAALRDWCPLPADKQLDHWAAVLDVGGEPSDDSWRVFQPLMVAAGDIRRSKAIARRAFRVQLERTPGVLLTHGVAADVSLGMTRWDPGVTMTEHHSQALEDLRYLWQLPDGTELVDALEQHRCQRTLSLGFWTRWTPGTVNEEWDERRKVWQRIGSFDPISDEGLLAVEGSGPPSASPRVDHLGGPGLHPPGRVGVP